jgi:hypothetical protein
MAVGSANGRLQNGMQPVELDPNGHHDWSQDDRLPGLRQPVIHTIEQRSCEM